jgi:hypothetical protein
MHITLSPSVLLQLRCESLIDEREALEQGNPFVRREVGEDEGVVVSRWVDLCDDGVDSKGEGGGWRRLDGGGEVVIGALKR